MNYEGLNGMENKIKLRSM